MSSLLEIPEALHAADSALRRIGMHVGERAWGLMDGACADHADLRPLMDLKKEAGLEGDQLERPPLWHATRLSLPRVASLPVDQPVRAQLDQDLRQLHTMDASLEAGSYHFYRAAKMATLRRFPAGPVEWELNGVPRSWVQKAAFPANLRFLAFVMFRLHGWAPYFFGTSLRRLVTGR